ncbi:MAG: histidine kinase [Bacteroidales bacterium]|nr:histidine kinase [Bacteroidales bacterium]
MKSIKLGWIIHIFALLHAVTALSCRFAGIADELLLTILTMALALIICMQKGLKIEFTAAIVIITNILGFLLGTFGARLLETFIHSEYAVHCISTAVTTEILGWCIIAIANIFGQKGEKPQNLKSAQYLKWILLIASGIFIMRLFIVLFLSNYVFETDMFYEVIGNVMTNSFSLIILVCVNIMFIRSVSTRDKTVTGFSTLLIYSGFMLLAALLESFLVGMKEENFLLVFFVSLVAQITLYCIVYVINYAITARNEMQEEREKANMAQYRYIKLKHQVNPHFLFNSLNILDCLICEEKTERASTYTHKLAGIYRYMIKSEDEIIVPLRDELEFVRLYVDLLKERFSSGFDVNVDVPEECMGRFVLSCSLQLLIENATKHNAVSTDNPLIISIEANDDQITVTNALIPKVTKAQSTGLGQKYIRQMYLDLTGKLIDITETDKAYSVTLPLI